MKLVDCGLIWSVPRKIETRDGVKMLKTAHPNEKFWELHREKGDELYRCGVTVSNFKGNRTVNWWTTRGVFLDLKEEELTEVSQKEWAKFMNQYDHFATNCGDEKEWVLSYYHVKSYDRNGEPVLGELLSKNTYHTAKVSKYFVNNNTTAPKNEITTTTK